MSDVASRLLDQGQQDFSAVEHPDMVTKLSGFDEAQKTHITRAGTARGSPLVEGPSSKQAPLGERVAS